MSPAAAPQIVRTFWHGAPLGPYQLLCLRSFVDAGHCVELFCYDDLAVPPWIDRRSARDILPTDRVLRYQNGFGRGSPSLHSNLFRYALLQRHGGWWIDCDVLLLHPDLPGDDIFVALQSDAEALCGSAMMRWPAHHRLLEEAEDECRRVSERAEWGQTGPTLLTRLAAAHGLAGLVRPAVVVFPIGWTDIASLFDPDRADATAAACAGSLALHLFNEVWRGAGIPPWLGPPRGSFLDRKLQEHDFGVRLAERMRYGEVERWISNRNQAIIHREQAVSYGNQIENTRAVVDKLATELQALRDSSSWKLTAPLRQIVRLMRGEV